VIVNDGTDALLNKMGENQFEGRKDGFTLDANCLQVIILKYLMMWG